MKHVLAGGEEVDGDAGADDLLDVTTNDGDLHHEPEHDAGDGRVLVAAHFRQVEAGDAAEARRQELQDQSEDGGPHQHPQELLFEGL